MTIKLEGFHGTDSAHVDSILNEGFKPSLGFREWLGDGAYFFVEGLNCEPEKQAEQWAIYKAWDNRTKKNKYLSYTVLNGTVEVLEENFLDLTTANGVEVLDYLQQKCTSKLSKIKKKVEFIDGYLINFARSENFFDVKVTKGNFYIKLRKEDRLSNLSRRSPNCTICSVYNPNENIVNIEITKKGEVDHEIR